MTDLVAELGKYREKDEKTPQGEVIQDKETLNFSRVRKYMQDKNITEENFDTLFKVPTALDILRSGGTKGELEMIRIINEGQKYLEKIGEGELMERESVESFSSTAKKELIRRNEENKLPLLQDSYRAYDTVRQLARRALTTKRKVGEEREAQKTSVEKGLKDSFQGVIDEVKKHYNESSTGEKAIAVGALLVGALMLFNSDKYGEKVKSALWTVAKIAGIGVGANYLYKMFTGKTALEAAGEWTKGSVGRDGFWQDVYKTDAEKAAIIQKSVVHLGNKDFLMLAKAYQTANNAVPPENKVKVPGVMNNDMSPEEIYTALDVFFKRYPREKLELRYRNARPPLNWATVVSAEMAEDGSIKMDGNLASRTVDNMKEYAIRGWNAFWVTEAGFGLNRYLYKKVWGKDPTDQDIKNQSDKLRSHLEDEVNSESEVDAFFDRTMSPDHAKQFRLMKQGNKRDARDRNIAFMEVPNDSIYVMSESKLDASMSSDKAVDAMLNNALHQVEDFLKRKYPDAADNLYRFIDIEEMRGVRVAESSTFKLFIRMPVKGSPEYSHKSVMLPTAGGKEQPGVEVFGVGDKIEYAKMEPQDQEHLRVRFMLDATQTAEIDKICAWYTGSYRTKGLTRKEVMRLMLEDDKVRSAALEQTAIKQNLKASESVLAENEEKLAKIEKSAASSYEGKDAYEHLQAYMKKTAGYKVRLAILGDDAARNYFIGINAKKYDPAQNADWLADLIKEYKKMCEEAADNYSKGNLKID